MTGILEVLERSEGSLVEDTKNLFSWKSIEDLYNPSCLMIKIFIPKVISLSHMDKLMMDYFSPITFRKTWY